jgi:endogenous inhibitor of DNA gyrase (YacG/DUF329 family)
MKPRPCAKCGRTFTWSTARKFYGKGSVIYHSKFCSTECRELHRLGRRAYELRAAVKAS